MRGGAQHFLPITRNIKTQKVLEETGIALDAAAVRQLAVENVVFPSSADEDGGTAGAHYVVVFMIAEAPPVRLCVCVSFGGSRRSAVRRRRAQQNSNGPAAPPPHHT